MLAAFAAFSDLVIDPFVKQSFTFENRFGIVNCNACRKADVCGLDIPITEVKTDDLWIFVRYHSVFYRVEYVFQRWGIICRSTGENNWIFLTSIDFVGTKLNYFTIRLKTSVCISGELPFNSRNGYKMATKVTKLLQFHPKRL